MGSPLFELVDAALDYVASAVHLAPTGAAGIPLQAQASREQNAAWRAARGELVSRRVLLVGGGVLALIVLLIAAVLVGVNIGIRSPRWASIA